MAVQNPKDKAALADNKFAVYPILDTTEGRLANSNAIMSFLANGHAMAGASSYEKAAILNWMDFSASFLEPVVLQLVAPIFGQLSFDEKKHDLALRDLRSVLQVLNDQLKKTSHVVGSKVTLADLVIGCALVNAYRFVLDAEFRKSFLAVFTWFERLVILKEFKLVWGHIHACYTPLSAPAKTEGV